MKRRTERRSKPEGFLMAILVFVVLIGLLSIAAPRSAEAIPAFSRLYAAECTACHTIFPQRSEFGEAFEKNGYVWPNESKTPVKQPPPGTERERKLQELYSLTGLPPILPISLSISSSYNFDKDHTVFNAGSAEFSAGAPLFGDAFSFFAVIPAGSAANEAFIYARNPFSLPFLVRTGKLQPNAAFKKSNDRLGSGAASAGNLTLNGFTISTPQNAVEVSSVIAGRFFVDAGAIDRTIGTRVTGQKTQVIGTDSTGGNVTTTVKTAESVNDKEYYGHAQYRFSGADFNGKEPDVDLSKESVWDFLSVTVSGFGYLGKNLTGTGDEVSFTRTALEGNVQYKKLIISLGQQQGLDKNTGVDVRSTGDAADITWQFNAKFAAVYRYTTTKVNNGDKEVHSIPAIVFAPRQNVKIQLYSDTKTTTPNGGDTSHDTNTRFSIQMLM